MGRPNFSISPCLRCSESDMTCPRDEPLEDRLDALYARGYETHLVSSRTGMRSSALKSQYPSTRP